MRFSHQAPTLVFANPHSLQHGRFNFFFFAMRPHTMQQPHRHWFISASGCLNQNYLRNTWCGDCCAKCIWFNLLHTYGSWIIRLCSRAQLPHLPYRCWICHKHKYPLPAVREMVSVDLFYDTCWFSRSGSHPWIWRLSTEGVLTECLLRYTPVRSL